MKRWKKWIAAAMAVTLLSSGGGYGLFGGMAEVKADNCGGLLEEDVYQPDPDEVIQDPILHWAVRSAMNAVKSGVKLTAEMVADPSVQNISYELCNHPEDFEGWKWPYYIESLEGLQYATSAKMIDIGYTANIEGKKIDSVEPLAPLTQLEILYLKQDGIADISPLKGLVNLQELNLSGNYDIADISAVKDMKKLVMLDISTNSVKDLTPIEGLTSLERLNAANNEISELPDMSNLEKLTAVDLSENQLTNVDELAKLTNLEEINLSGNDGLTDITALAALTSLEEDSCYLPTTQMKTDLFAAINVNRQFLKFNISKMTQADLENVAAALQAYEDLTADQKEYIDAGMIQAAEENQEKVQAGQEPTYYPEYDKGGEAVPVLDRIVIHVVDKYGKPVEAGIKFERKDDFGSVTTKETNAQGVVEFIHGSFDSWGTFVVRPAGDAYVAEPEKFTYYVNGDGETGTINNEPATGLENLTMTLIPADEYVDKSDLKAAVNECDGILTEESYKYTADSWSAYEKALADAREVLENVDASKEDVADAAEVLREAYEGLKKADILTRLKLTIVDENGNPFTREFKIQIRNPENYGEAWNAFSDPESSVAYLETSPAWADGKKWEVLACYEEPYEFDKSIMVTIGKKDGQTYFKEVDGQEADVDYEAEVRLIPEEKETAIFEPDSTVLKSYITRAEKYEEDDYTPASWEALQKALTAANEAVESGKTQEDYNQAAVDLQSAVKGLTEKANKVELENAINEYYYEDSYTPGSWQAYLEAKEAAQKIYDDPNATQEKVDQAVKALQKAQADLVFNPTKTALNEKIQEAEALDEADYSDGWEELQTALEEAKKVYADPDADQDAVDAQVEKLEEAIAGLKEVPVQAEVTCDQYTFRAIVQDAQGNRLSGIKFILEREGTDETTTLTSKNGVLEYPLNYLEYGTTSTVSLAEGQGYITPDIHKFTAGGTMFGPWFETIDGKPFQSGITLVYTLTEVGVTPPEEEVLSDETTFRAKAVDEEGNPVEGVTFDLVPDDSLADSYEVTTNAEGILEHELTFLDYALTFTVSLGDEQSESWTCTETHKFKTDGTAVTAPTVVTIDDKPLAEAGEVVFHLTKNGGSQPSVDKSGLQAKITEAKGISGDAYTEESFGKLQDAIEAAQSVYDDGQATKEEVEAQIAALEKAISDLEKKPEQPGGEEVLSDETTFRAKAVDEEGNPVEGVTFDLVPDDSLADSYEVTTNAEGILEHELTFLDYALTFTVSLGDEQSESWACTETHEFATDGTAVTVPTIVTIDDKPLAEAGEVVFHLTKGSGSQPTVDKSELEGWLGSAATYPEDEYTPETYEPLKKAVEQGQKVMDDPEATEEEVKAACEAIEEAINGLEEADLPVYCDRNNIRIKVVDENGERVENGIAFSIDRDGSVYNATTYSGEIGYMLSTADLGTSTVTVSLKNGSVIRDGKEYVAEPEQYVFKLKDEDPAVVIDTIDGKPFTGKEQLIFTLKEKKEEVVDKSDLQAAIATAETLVKEEDSYTLNSFQALETALADARSVNENEAADQAAVDQAKETLQKAIDGLKKVQGTTTLVLPVKLNSGEAAPANTEFVRRDVKYSVNNRIFVNGDGNLVWEPNSYDEGEYEFYLPETSAYIATPERITVQVGKEDGTSVITSKTGEGFTLSAKETDKCDLTTFRAVVRDENGNLLAGIKFDVTNGDPAELTSDESGVIAYEATMWDTDTTMTVKLQSGQGYTCSDQAEFSVIADPEDPERAILGTVNGQPFKGGEQIIFKLAKEGSDEPERNDLEEVMDEAGKLDPDRYTEDSFAKVTEAMEAAEAVYADPDASQSQIDAAKEALQAAINGLQEKPRYQFIAGADQTVPAGGEAVFEINGQADKLEKVLVDEKTLSEDQYSVSEKQRSAGNVVITLSSEYLATLDAGKHTVEIVFADGSVQAQFTLAEKESGEDPEDPQDPQNPQDPQPGGDSQDSGDIGKDVNDSQSVDGTNGQEAAKTQDTNMPLLWMLTGAGALAVIFEIQRKKIRR